MATWATLMLNCGHSVSGFVAKSAQPKQNEVLSLVCRRASAGSACTDGGIASLVSSHLPDLVEELS